MEAKELTIKYRSFNVNEHVRVRLTELGYQLLADDHNAYLGAIPNWNYRTADYYKSKADSEGYTIFQMWDFMQKFGGELIGICKPQHFHNDILFNEDELTPID